MLLFFLALAPCMAHGLMVPAAQKPLEPKPLHDERKTQADFHPDPFYKPYSSTEQISACHRGQGPAGVFGAETSDCDSPFSLVNATFQWIEDNLKGSIDFIIWTGDSARHDSDEEIPRTEKQVLDLNTMLVAKFTEVFGKDHNANDTDPMNEFVLPIVPTLGNNDIMPHNILSPGPNRWTEKFSHVWRNFIPESQRHSFERGGWFFVEVIPNQLAVFSLNTLYFYGSNTAVDGCAKKSEPGYEHMEWLRVQLEFLRQRGMKAIIMGHIPPARTESKMSWDETCWQKYALWMRQYRDVVVGSLYGHMNIDHFILQDFQDIRKKTVKGKGQRVAGMVPQSLEDDFTIQSSAEYLTALRTGWSKIPEEPGPERESMLQSGNAYDIVRSLTRGKKHKSKREKYLKKIGGEWAERYTFSTVTPSVVPNYFPAMRVIEYNITGIDGLRLPSQVRKNDAEETELNNEHDMDVTTGDSIVTETKDSKKKRKSKHKKHRKKKPEFTIPDGPSKSSPPGPAYSPQTFTWLSYTQYYANLTRINNDFHDSVLAKDEDDDGMHAEKKWRKGKHRDRKPKKKLNPQSFHYEVEYDTKTDKVYGMPDLTVQSWLKLAKRIGKYKPAEEKELFDDDDDDDDDDDFFDNEERTDSEAKVAGSYGTDDILDLQKCNSRRRKHHGRKATNRVWFTFLKRAFVGTKSDEELHEKFGDPIDEEGHQ
ncbi:MAG: hypothetical protein Q9163_001004 [Psora crenata]